MILPSEIPRRRIRVLLTWSIVTAAVGTVAVLLGGTWLESCSFGGSIGGLAAVCLMLD